MLAGCSRKQEAGVARVAIPPFENLSGNPVNDWVSVALQDVVTSDLTGTPTLQPLAVRSAREVPAAGAKQTIAGYFTIQGDTLTVNATLRDLASEKSISSYTISRNLRGGVLPAGNELAKKVNSNARTYGAASDDVLRMYAEAKLKGSPAEAAQHLEKTVAADAAFGEAWVALVQAWSTAGQPAKAKDALDRSRNAGEKIRPIERARLNFLSATLNGDAAGQVQSLEALQRLVPADGSLPATLAQAEFNLRHFAKSAEWYRQAAMLEPANGQFWNMAMYANAFAGNFDSVKTAFEEYRKSTPGNPNTFDSLGEAAFALGRFDEAEKAFLEAHQVAPTFLDGWTLVKAAQARLMRGDKPGANKLFQDFLEARKKANDGRVDYQQARWEYATGDQKAATRRLESWIQTNPNGDAAAMARARLAAWKLQAGDAAAARELSAMALKQAANPGIRLQAFLCQFAAQPKNDVAGLNAQAQRMLPAPAQAGVRNMALGYALLFSKEFNAAAGVWKTIYESTPPTVAGEPAVLLAWAYAESGRPELAKPLLERFPIPNPANERVFDFLEYPRVLQLREKLGLK